MRGLELVRPHCDTPGCRRMATRVFVVALPVGDSVCAHLACDGCDRPGHIARRIAYSIAVPVQGDARGEVLS